MVFLVKVPWSIVSFVSQLLQGETMGFEQVFDNLTFKRMTALRKQIQSVADYFQSTAFGYMQSYAGIVRPGELGGRIPQKFTEPPRRHLNF